MTVRLTMAQALVRYMAAQYTLIDEQKVPLFGGVWAIFGHGNVAGMGEALYAMRDKLPTFRAHNEQAMAHAAIAYAKALRRRRFMACTTSIGPGATNMVTAAALAHVNRLPVLLLPGDVFANRRPDPVLQQIESFGDGTLSANDCFRPVSRYWDRITRPEQLLTALPRAIAALTDPAECGPVTLCLCQDVQAEAFDYPEAFFDERTWFIRRPGPDQRDVVAAAAILGQSKRPVIIAGGGVLYSDAANDLKQFAEAHGIPIGETQAGKGAVPSDHPLNLGAIGVTGTQAANECAAEADAILCVGTRLQDFTTGSWTLFRDARSHLIQLNVAAFDAHKHHAHTLICDAQEGLRALTAALASYRTPQAWQDKVRDRKQRWLQTAAQAVAADNEKLPSDAQVLGVVNKAIDANGIVVCAAGGLPGELHKLWHVPTGGSYHIEYGYSCMGYEIAGGLGVKMACPDRTVVVMVGDGSYLMMNSEIATSVMLGLKLVIVVLDNRGFGCINRLQNATGNESFNNLLRDSHHISLPAIDFRAHAASLGAWAEKVEDLNELESAIGRALDADRTSVVVIDTDPMHSTKSGGHWWDVAVPQVSDRSQVRSARQEYDKAQVNQRLGS